MNDELMFNLELNHVMELLSQCLSPMEQLQCYLSGQQGSMTQETEARPQEKRILRCPAEGCGKVFRSSPGYRYHLKSHASDPRPHQCRCCMKKFKSANGLKYHLRKSHSIEPVASKAKALLALSNNETTNGNDDSESTGEDDCVVPSLPPEHLLSKHSPQQHESVLRMSHSLPEFKSDHVFKTEPNLGYKHDHNFNYKAELLMNNNNDHNNNNHYTRLGSYDEPDNICYGSQGEPNTRYGSYPDTNSMNIRYGVEGGRYSCSTDEMESVRFGSQSYSPDYSPRPGHRDHFRENFRDGPRNDYHQRRSSVSDYYQQRSMVPQDRYPGVIGYSGPDTPSRFNYPRFDFPARNFGMNRGDYLKSENVYRNHSQYETRNEFVKPNESVIRSPADFVNKNECAGIKSTESRSAPARNPFVPKTASDEFVKPTYTRSDFVARQNTNDSELQHKIEKPLPVNANAGRFPQSENSHFNGVTKVENKDDEAKPDSPTRKSQPKTDINGNTVLETSGILKRRSSKPIPPALVIEPPVNSSEEKKEETSKLLPPEVNRLTEFAEFAISPHSPLVQSPFPLTLTPGLLGAGSTPDWMTKSFTRFFFPDKPLPYLNASGLSTSRHTQDEDDGEGRPTPSSLPPSPFIDNVSTPQPFWTTQAWPTPVWHCFMKGCVVKFEIKDEEFRRVEDIACCNSLLNKRNEEANYALNGLIVIDIKETKDIIMTAKGAKDRVLLTFDSTTPGQQRLLVKCPADHLFLVKHRGWSSPRPNEAMACYGIPFRCLQKGDICIQSGQHRESNSNTLSPLVACTEEFPFATSDSSAANTLSAMAKRQESTAEKSPAAPLMSTSSASTSSPATDPVSPATTAPFSPRSEPLSTTGPYPPADVPYSAPGTSTQKDVPYSTTTTYSPRNLPYSTAATFSPRDSSFSTTATFSPRDAPYTSTGTYSPRDGPYSTTAPFSPRNVPFSTTAAYSPRDGPYPSNAAYSPRDGPFSSNAAYSPRDAPYSNAAYSPRDGPYSSTAAFSPREAPYSTAAAYSPEDVPYSMVMSTNEPSIPRHANMDNFSEHKNAQQQQPHKKVKRKRKTNNLEEKQRRPMNGFMLFAKKMRIELTQKFPGKDNRAISKVLGEQWRALSGDERKDFATKAKVMADERRKINPDCWKRKRKKSKGGDRENENDKIMIKQEQSPGPSSHMHGKGSMFAMA